MKVIHSLTALCLIALASPSFACSVPVFRYALENWQPDRLTVAVLHDGTMSAQTQTLVDKLELAAHGDQEVNLRLHPIDVSVDHPDGSAEAFHAEHWRDKQLPHMLVYFSNNAPEPQLAWSAELTATNVRRLLQSPARKMVVERLLDGHTAVWALLKTGNKSADDRAEKALRDELAKKPDEIELPSFAELATEEKFDEGLNVDMRVEFSIITIDPDDEEEVFFREMLLNTEADLRDFNDPIAIPIYGRGRTYFALVGPGITADNIDDNCSFICGACSCEVKRDNPGQDLLLAANWNQIQPGNWVNDTPLPELTGIGGFEPIAATTDAESGENLSGTALAAGASSEDEALKPTLVASLPTTPTASATEPSATNTEAAPAAGTSTDVIAPMILLWGVVLFGIGLVFTVWQRRQSAE